MWLISHQINLILIYALKVHVALCFHKTGKVLWWEPILEFLDTISQVLLLERLQYGMKFCFQLHAVV